MSLPMVLPPPRRARPETCLSDLALDAYLIGEMSGRDERAAVERHLASCSTCQMQHDVLASAPQPTPDPIFWRRQQPAPVVPVRRVRVSRNWVGGLAVAAAAAAVLVVVLPSRPGDRAAPGGDTRTKGGALALEIVARRPDGQILPVFEATPLHPGDAIRFVVSAPAAGHVAVVGLDAAGQTSVYAPPDDGDPQAVEAGSHPLPGSVVLDGTLGEERLYAVFCQSPLARATLAAAGARALAAAGGDPRRAGHLDVPCQQTSALLRKEAIR